ncbi:MAG: NADH-quinone oxidoreductase subunit L [Caldilineae bacterium]|nr:NADH-quinone oxidoreductase subunit L [Chloroflexota bacterium]MCB9176502.1 NADH-quinone oxidoreductase subunit L [Caldilineae bacterium]
MSLIELLPLVPALPLAGVLLLLAGGRRLPGKAAAWLASGLVGAAFLLSLGIAIEYRGLAAAGSGSEHATPEASAEAPGAAEHAAEAPVIVQTLWRWMDVGADLVEISAARQELPMLEAVPEGAVGPAWFDLRLLDAVEDPAARAGLEAGLSRMWLPEAVVGEMPMQALPAGMLVTLDNVPPAAGRDAATLIVDAPRRERRFTVDLALQLDALSIVMLLVVTGVGFLIHVYSIGYMAHDADIRRYFTYLNLFVFSMLTLVLGAGFLVMFVGWELVGACSYLLIGFWYQDPANASAGRKAFIVNRIGDLAFLIGMMLIWTTFGSLAYGEVLPAAAGQAGTWVALAIPALLLVGATGKSAQIPLFVWLPDAMAGPTPVSALIHAATMVTAGVYMIARSHSLFEAAPQVMAVVATVGALTALVAALIAAVQVDIKRVLAYSTISQLGYMFLAVGAGAYVAGIFHLMTHAFFKALLFLGAGSVMHAMEHGFAHAHAHPETLDGIPPEQDMRHMGGLLGRIPATGWTFVIGGLALAGFPGLAGFWSKDEILFETIARDLAAGRVGLWTLLYGIGSLTALLTAFYTGRQLLMVLAGQPRSAGAEQAADSPWLMTLPLGVLALLSLVGGLVNAQALGIHALADFLAPVLGGHEAEFSALPFIGLAIGIALAGLGLAWWVYGPKRELLAEDGAFVDPIATRLPRYHKAAWNRFYVDELYAWLVVRPFRRSADFLWHVVDEGMVDSTVNGAGRLMAALGGWLRGWQTGYVRSYALSVLAGAVIIALWLFRAAW